MFSLRNCSFFNFFLFCSEYPVFCFPHHVFPAALKAVWGVIICDSGAGTTSLIRDKERAHDRAYLCARFSSVEGVLLGSNLICLSITIDFLFFNFKFFLSLRRTMSVI